MLAYLGSSITLAPCLLTVHPRNLPWESLVQALPPWQQRWYEIIFEADTPAGKTFDVGLLVVILASVGVVMLESIPEAELVEIHPRLKNWLRMIEWVITLLFSFEYLARIACVLNPSKYIFSFFGIVDLLALLPTYLGLFFHETHVLATVRSLRLLRVFRVFKMGQHVAEANLLLIALRRTWPKITVFLSVIFCAIVILGTVMFLIERDQDSGFDSIPRSIYWAIVTMTTVGYGDIAPTSVAGQTLAAIIMLFGYAVIIVPTGIFSAEVLSHGSQKSDTIVCSNCSHESRERTAKFCSQCGTALE